jgi:hypothetical protein
MTLDELLAEAGPLLPAWELNDRIVHTVRVHRIGSDGAALVGRADVDPKEVEVTNNTLQDRGLRVGNAYHRFVWVLDDAGLGVWSKTAQLADGTRDDLRIGSERLRAGDIKGVATFVEPENWGHRGVRMDVGNRIVIVAEENFSVENNPSYSAMDLDMEIMWADFLGRDLALWLGLPYADRHGKITNKTQLDIYTACCALADKLTNVPERGEFEFVFHSVGSIDGSGDVVLRLAPNPLEEKLRFIELRVHTETGQSWYGRWLKIGTNAQIARFLRNVRTPAMIMLTTPDLRRKLAEDGYK